MAETDKTPDGQVAETNLQAAANIPAATEFSTSGAPVQVVPDVDADHPAVDNNPRASTTVLQNKIDFNDPTKPGYDAVTDNLNAQGVPTKGPDEAAADAKKASRTK
jgi:hypothetical protein